MKSYSLPYLRFIHTDSHAECEARIRQALVDHPEDHVALHHQLAMQLIAFTNGERSDEAIAISRHMVDHGEDSEDVSTGFELMAICYEHFKGDKDMAIQCFISSLEHFPANDSSLYRLAQLYKQKNEYEKALHYFKLMEQYDPGSALDDVGECHLELKNYDEAQANLEAALPRYTTVSVYNGLGRCAAERGDSKKAMEYFQLALELDKAHYATNYYIGLVYQDWEDYYRALHYYSQAIKAWPKFADAMNNMAICFECLGDDPNASLEQLEKALDTNPTPQLQLLLYTNLARLHSKRKNFDQHEYYQGKVFQLLGFNL